MLLKPCEMNDLISYFLKKSTLFLPDIAGFSDFIRISFVIYQHYAAIDNFRNRNGYRKWF